MFIEYFNKKQSEIIKHQESIQKDLGGVLTPAWQIFNKHKMWNSLKNALIKIYNVKEDLSKGKLLMEAFERIITNKWAYFNGPRQIWMSGEKQDSMETIQHATNQFFIFTLENEKLKPHPESNLKPSYIHTLQRCKKKIEYLSEILSESELPLS